MGTMTEVVPGSEAELVDLAAGTYGSILRSGREMLRLKFELGRLVTIHLWSPSYYVGTAGHVSAETIQRYIERSAHVTTRR